MPLLFVFTVNKRSHWFIQKATISIHQSKERKYQYIEQIQILMKKCVGGSDGQPFTKDSVNDSLNSTTNDVHINN